MRSAECQEQRALLCCSRLLGVFMESTSQARCLFPPGGARDVINQDHQVMFTLALIRQEGGIMLHLGWCVLGWWLCVCSHLKVLKI